MNKIIVAGSRDIVDKNIVVSALVESGFIKKGDKKSEIEIVSGGARGVDSIGEYIARVNGFNLKVFPADWNKYGKRAGPLRNIEMGNYADCLVAIRLNNSRGTTHMIEYMQSLRKPVHIVDITL